MAYMYNISAKSFTFLYTGIVKPVSIKPFGTDRVQIRQVFGLHRLYRHLVVGTVKSVWFSPDWV